MRPFPKYPNECEWIRLDRRIDLADVRKWAAAAGPEGEEARQWLAGYDGPDGPRGNLYIQIRCEWDEICGGPATGGTWVEKRHRVGHDLLLSDGTFERGFVGFPRRRGEWGFRGSEWIEGCRLTASQRWSSCANGIVF